MKKKILIITISIISLIVIGLITYFTFFKDNKSNCIPLTGGSYILKINKNNNEEIEEISVCIACSPDSYTTIETPTYSGYTFIGWYYDSELKEKAEIGTTLDIEPIEEKDSQGCITGYKTQEIYAKWVQCPDGYAYEDDICTFSNVVDATPIYTCSEGTLNGTKCVSTENPIYNCVENGVQKGIYDDNKGFAFGTIVNGQCQVTYKKVNISDDFIGIGDVFDFENLVCNGVMQGTCTISVTAVEQHNMCNDGYTYSNGTCIKEISASISQYTCSEGTLDGTKCHINKTAEPTYK